MSTLTEQFAVMTAAFRESAQSAINLHHNLPPKSTWGSRRLQRFKTQNGKRTMQLHATRGWKWL